MKRILHDQSFRLIAEYTISKATACLTPYAFVLPSHVPRFRSIIGPMAVSWTRRQLVERENATDPQLPATVQVAG